MTISASDICDAIGRANLARNLGVGMTSISNAVVANRFPAKWFAVVSDMCASAGLDCPRRLFAFIDPNGSEGSTISDNTEAMRQAG